MAQDFAVQFYKSKNWQKARASYLKQVGYLCEGCKLKGILTPAEIVHHKIHLDANNINCPEITTGFANLKAVCRKCHADEHDEVYGRKEKRYTIDVNGKIIF